MYAGNIIFKCTISRPWKKEKSNEEEEGDGNINSRFQRFSFLETLIIRDIILLATGYDKIILVRFGKE